MITNRLRLLPMLALGLTAALAACQPKALSMTPEEAQRVEVLTANMTTRCVGRYLLDLPEFFVLNSESRTEVEEVKVAVEPMDKRLFESSLEAREMVLRREKIMGKETPSLLAVHKLPNEEGLVFDRSESREVAMLRTFELFAWKDGYLIQMSVNARNMSLATRIFPNDIRRTDTPEKLAHLLAIYERVSGRQDTHIPKEPGLCIANGFVAGAGRDEQDAGLVYHLANAPDVWFGVNNDDLVKADTTLFQRAPDIERGMKREQVKTLRKTKRTVHGQSYEEWLFGNVPFQDDVRGTKFLLHGNETGANPDQPFLKLALYNGDRIPVPELSMEQKDRLGLFKPLTKATWTNAEALAIWDKVTATLRPRPGAF